MRRLAPYLLTAAVGLGLGGGASAAGGLVTGQQVKDRSLHGRDFSLRARRVLRRSRGPRGALGKKGDAGPSGPPGPQGPASSAGPDSTATLVAAGPVAGSGVEYLSIGGSGSTPSEADSQLLLPVSGYLIQMRARVAQASASGAREVRMRINEGDVTTCCGPVEYVCSIPPGGLTCQSEAPSFSGLVYAGDRLSVQVTSASSTATDASVVFEVRAY